MPSEHPILFSTAMARTILEGRKTQTRRVVKPQPPKDYQCLGLCTEGDDEGKVVWQHPDLSTTWHPVRPPYAVGDILWVREPAKVIAHKIEYFNSHVTYQFADGTIGHCKIPARLESPNGAPPKWVYMCQGVPNGCIREMARSYLRVKSVRVERLQDISEEDAKAEGLYVWKNDSGDEYYGISREDVWEPDPRLTFERLWDSINAKHEYDWNSNPWVWVVEFEHIDKSALPTSPKEQGAEN